MKKKLNLVHKSLYEIVPPRSSIYTVSTIRLGGVTSLTLLAHNQLLNSHRDANIYWYFLLITKSDMSYRNWS